VHKCCNICTLLAVCCCQSASYAIGNAAYHGPELYIHLRPSIPLLLRLLHDPLAKIRANAAGLSIFNTKYYISIITYSIDGHISINVSS